MAVFDQSFVLYPRPYGGVRSVVSKPHDTIIIRKSKETQTGVLYDSLHSLRLLTQPANVVRGGG
jgi:hypothetical protein